MESTPRGGPAQDEEWREITGSPTFGCKGVAACSLNTRGRIRKDSDFLNPKIKL